LNGAITRSIHGWAVPKSVRRRVLCASLADVFEDWDGPVLDHQGSQLTNATFETAGPNNLPLTLDDLRHDLSDLIDATPYLDWLLLTKRPENVLRMTTTWSWHACETGDCPHSHRDDCDSESKRKYRENVWIGTSVENQEQANKRIPELLKCRNLSPVLFLSCEPLLGSIQFGLVPDDKTRPAEDSMKYTAFGSGIDWVIAGGESGPQARPSHPDWFHSLQLQCKDAGVPFFFKQWGEWCQLGDCGNANQWTMTEVDPVLKVTINGDYAGEYLTDYPWPNENYPCMIRIGKRKAGRKLFGFEYSEFPRANYKVLAGEYRD